jgi:hypothetical protein
MICYLQVCFDDDRTENLNSSFKRFVILNMLLVVFSSGEPHNKALKYKQCVDHSYSIQQNAFICLLQPVPLRKVSLHYSPSFDTCSSFNCIHSLFLVIYIISHFVPLHSPPSSEWSHLQHFHSQNYRKYSVTPMNNTNLYNYQYMLKLAHISWRV